MVSPNPVPPYRREVDSSAWVAETRAAHDDYLSFIAPVAMPGDVQRAAQTDNVERHAELADPARLVVVVKAERQQHQLGVDLVDRARNQLVWEGAASGRVTDSVRQNIEQVSHDAVAEIFLQFP